MRSVKAKQVAVWVLQSLLAGLFAIQAFVKLNGSPAWITRFRGWGYPDHFYLAVGVAELVGAILLLIPSLVRFGALLLILVMIGATATHLLHREPQVITTFVLLGLLSVVMYLRRSPRN
jgi:putative oxidoreductase